MMYDEVLILTLFNGVEIAGFADDVVWRSPEASPDSLQRLPMEVTPGFTLEVSRQIHWKSEAFPKIIQILQKVTKFH